MVVVNAPPDEPIENTLFLPDVEATATPILAVLVLQIYAPTLPVDNVMFTAALNNAQSVVEIAFAPAAKPAAEAMLGTPLAKASKEEANRIFFMVISP